MIAEYDHSVSGNASDVIFANLGNWDDIEVVGKDVSLSSSGQVMLRVSTDNGSTFHTTGYTLVSPTNGTLSGSSTILCSTAGNTTAARVFLFEVRDLGERPYGYNRIAGVTGFNPRLFNGNSLRANAVQILGSAGSITGGTIRIYGMPRV